MVSENFSRGLADELHLSDLEMSELVYDSIAVIYFSNDLELERLTSRISCLSERRVDECFLQDDLVYVVVRTQDLEYISYPVFDVGQTELGRTRAQRRRIAL